MARSVNHAKLAAEALSNLNMFYAIKAMTENGLFRGEEPCLRKIRKLCSAGSTKALFEYDRHMAIANATPAHCAEKYLLPKGGE